MVDFQDIRHYRRGGRAAQRGRRGDLAGHAADPKAGRNGHLPRAGAARRRWHPGPQPGRPGVLPASSALRRVADFSLNAANELTAHWLRRHGADARHGVLRPEPRQLLDLVGGRAGRLAGSGRSISTCPCSTWSTACFVRCSRRAQQDQLRPALRSAHGRASRPHRHASIRWRPTSAAATRCSTPGRKARPNRAAAVAARRAALPRRTARRSAAAETGRASIGLYRELLAGRVPGSDVWRQLQAANRVGVTRGTLEERRNPQAIL